MHAKAITSLPYFGLFGRSHHSTDDRRRVVSCRIMPPPLPPATIAGIPGTVLVRTVDPYHFRLIDGRWVTIPSGFVSDGPSIPPIFRALVGQYDLGVEAWLIHDWLLRHGSDYGLTREDADDHFQVTLERQLVDPVKADLAVRAVRIRTEMESRMRNISASPSRGSAALYAMATATPLIRLGLQPGRLLLVAEGFRIAFKVYRDIRSLWFSRPIGSHAATYPGLSISQMVSLPPRQADNQELNLL
jgi:hypothetical protein